MRRASASMSAPGATRTRRPEYGSGRFASLASSRTSVQTSLSNDEPPLSKIPTTCQVPRPNSSCEPSLAPT